MNSPGQKDKNPTVSIGRYYPRKVSRYHIGSSPQRTVQRNNFNLFIFPEKLIFRRRNILYLASLVAFIFLFIATTRNAVPRDKIDVKIFYSLPFLADTQNEDSETEEFLPTRFITLPPAVKKEPVLELYPRESNETQALIKEAREIYVTYHPMFNESNPDGESCFIRHQNPFDSSLFHLIRRPKPISCNSSFPKLFESNLDSLVTISPPENYKLVNCCYKVIQRKDDFRSQVSQACYPVEGVSTKIPFEFIQVHCSTNLTHKNETEQALIDTFAFAPPIYKATKVPNTTTTQSPKAVSNVSTTNVTELIPPNVIILVLSSVSRMNLHRTMPLTIDYLSNNLSSMEFTKFSKTSSDFSSLLALLTGESVEQSVRRWGSKRGLTFDKCPFLWKDFASHGYSTLFAEDNAVGTFNDKKPGFWTQPVDYYFRTAALTAKDHCLGTLLLTEKVFEYSHQLTNSSAKHFQVLHFSSLTKTHEAAVSNLDKIFRKNLELMSPYLNNTALVFLSTQGLSKGEVRKTPPGSMEARNPFLFYVLPNWIKSRFYSGFKNVFDNQNKFTTAFDVHETLKDLLHLNISTKSLATRQRIAHQSLNRQKQALKDLERFKVNYQKANDIYKEATDLNAIKRMIKLNQTEEIKLDLDTFNDTGRFDYTLYYQTRWNASHWEKLNQVYFRTLLKTYSAKLKQAFGRNLGVEPEEMLEYKESIVNKLMLSSRNGISHFMDLPPNRECELAGIDDHSCPCIDMTPVDVRRSGLAEELAKAVIKTIIMLLHSYNLVLISCVYFKLAKVIHLSSSNSLNDPDNNFRIAFEAAPGRAIFEATLRKVKGRTQVKGISRLDSYEEHSYCIGIEELKKFCYCAHNPLNISEVEDAQPMHIDAL